MVKFEWEDEKKKDNTKLVKKDKNNDKMKYILIGIVIGILIGMVIFYILMSSGIIQPFLRGFIRPRGFTGPGNSTRPEGFTIPN